MSALLGVGNWMVLLVKLREPAAPPPPPVATAEPAAPGNIFRRRLVLDGGYQPPIRHRQTTQTPASRAPARRGPKLRAGGRGRLEGPG